MKFNRLDLDIKPSQKLALTPKMREAIEILQMNSLQIKNTVEEAMLENPMLSMDEDPLSAESQSAEKAPNTDAASSDTMDWQEYYESMQNGSVKGDLARPDFSELPDPLQKARHSDISLDFYLRLQLRLHADIPQKAGAYIIDHIDEDGYLWMDADQAEADLGLSLSELESVLKMIQTFDPPGVGARGIGECLSLQLKANDLWTPERQMLIDDWLLGIANNAFKKVAKATGHTEKSIADFKMMLKELNPRPGSVFDKEEPNAYIVPDGSIEWIDGQLTVHINDLGAPHLHISPFYYNMLKQTDSEAAQAYLENCLNKAHFLMDCIDMRRRTLTQTITAIAEFQEDYFLSRAKLLKPMTLDQIADMTGVHPSTISRAVKDKAIRTPRGTFPLKRFFAAGLPGDSRVSVDAVHEAIRQIIQEEDPTAPLSDQAITEKLSAKGIDISRRTVAKYRTELGIPAKSKRFH